MAVAAYNTSPVSTLENIGFLYLVQSGVMTTVGFLKVIRIILLHSCYILLSRFSWIFCLFRLLFMYGDWGRNYLLARNSYVCCLNQEMWTILEIDSLVVVFMKRIFCLMCSHNFLNRNCFTLDIIANFIYSITALNLFSRKYVCVYGFIYTYKYMQKNLSHRGHLSTYT